jgi:hypothetical protein
MAFKKKRPAEVFSAQAQEGKKHSGLLWNGGFSKEKLRNQLIHRIKTMMDLRMSGTKQSAWKGIKSELCHAIN